MALRLLKPQETKVCKTCKLELPASAFYPSRANRSNFCLQSKCINCQKIYWQKYKDTPNGIAANKKKQIKFRTTAKGRGQSLLNAAKTRARNFNYEFDLTQDWVIGKIESGYCELSGVKFDLSLYKTKNMRPYSPSIDRRDSNRGYTKDNCRVICWALNCAFSDWGEEVFRTIAKAYLERTYA